MRKPLNVLEGAARGRAAGKTLVAVQHKIVAGASDTLDRRVNNVHNDDMVEFVKEHSK